MMCAWKDFLSIIPVRIRPEVDRIGKDTLQELRLRINSPPELVTTDNSLWLMETVRREDLDYIVNSASRYSPWCSATVSQGYITAPGGHRIGICGTAVCQNGVLSGIRELSSICIRVARDFPGIAGKKIPQDGSILIIGAPGWGKTTLLRDLIRNISEKDSVSVVDERAELFPSKFSRGKKTDILTGCPKDKGIEMVLRTMAPNWIAVDEITAKQDTQALIHAANCGVLLIATAHAGSRPEFFKREIYLPLHHNKIFRTLVILHKDKTYHVERMTE